MGRFRDIVSCVGVYGQRTGGTSPQPPTHGDVRAASGLEQGHDAVGKALHALQGFGQVLGLKAEEDLSRAGLLEGVDVSGKLLRRARERASAPIRPCLSLHVVVGTKRCMQR